jgi:serine/threonine protein kinase
MSVNSLFNKNETLSENMLCTFYIVIGSESKPSAKPNENFVANFDHLHQLSKGSVWMVFEYLPFDLNGTIEKHKEKEDHFTIPEVKRILYDILSALQFCHSHNIIHRDLKSYYKLFVIYIIF